MEKILIVDDEKHMRLILSKILQNEGYQTFQAEDGHKAMVEIKQNNPQLVLLDYKLPDINGDKLLEKIKKYDNTIIVIMLTAFGDIKKAVTSMKLGAYDYLTKPFNNEEIILTIQKAFQNLHLKTEVKYLKKKLERTEEYVEIIGESVQIKKVIEQIDLVATSDISVFLEGETGTGKELAAHLIHKKSVRREFPFVAVDCGAIPETLFESEMFGHEKGAFTGAVSVRIGKFEQANGGTLFLDEITNLPLTMQAKLLRSIQEKKIMRLGGRQQIDVDVRIIAASNRNIAEFVRTGEFRSDLFYRLNEFKIELPSLRERKDDIPLLADYFLKKMNKSLKKNIQGFTPKTMNELLNYHWPGNIRELKNIIKRAALIAQDDYIQPEHLFFTNIQSESEPLFKENFSWENISKEVRHTKLKAIEQAIKNANGNKTLAAKQLGISRNQLYRILREAKNQTE
ncbi:MAG: DNA-binding response regulator [Candidatus Cloacimonadota bacterium]|nr:MAG: DNA-binding response regulator [Candidatus Cloacimonadota bacterium]